MAAMPAKEWRAEQLEWLLGVLRKRGAHADKAEEILDYFTPERITDVAVHNTHAPIRQVDAYGLLIYVDANGYAAHVHFPCGAEDVTE